MEYSTFGLNLEIKIKRKDTGGRKFNHAKLQRLATEQIQESLAKNFDTESYGKSPWKKLKPWYLKWKERNGFQSETLQQTGEMKKQILSGKAVLKDNKSTLQISYSVFMKGNVYKYIVPLTGANNGQKQTILSKKMYGRKATIKAKELGETGATGFIPQRRWDYIHKPNIDKIALELSNLIAEKEMRQN